MNHTNKLFLIIFCMASQLHAGFRDAYANPTLLAAAGTSLLSGWSLYQWHILNNRRRMLEKAVGISDLLQTLNQEAQAEEKELGPDWQVFYITERVYKVVLGQDNPYCQMLLNLIKKEKLCFAAGFFSGCASFVCWKQLYSNRNSLPFSI